MDTAQASTLNGRRHARRPGERMLPDRISMEPGLLTRRYPRVRPGPARGRSHRTEPVADDRHHRAAHQESELGPLEGAAGLYLSTGAVASRHEIGLVETFCGGIGVELPNRRTWKTRTERGCAVHDHIDCFRNARRRHTSLAKLAPTEYAHLHITTTATAAVQICSSAGALSAAV